MWASGRKDLLSTFSSCSRSLLFCSQNTRIILAGGFGSALAVLYWRCSPKCRLLCCRQYFSSSIGPTARSRKTNDFLLAVCHCSLCFAAIAVFGKTDTFSHSSPGMILLLSAKSIVYYLHRIVVPLHLTMFYPQTTPVTLASAEFFVPVILVIALLIGWSFWLASRRTSHSGGSFSSSRCCRISCTIPNEFVFYASDRYAYVSTISIALGFAALLVSLSKKRPQREKPIMLLCICLFAWYGWTAQVYATVWQTIQRSTVMPSKKSQLHRMPYNNYGTFLMREGKNRGSTGAVSVCCSAANNAPKLTAHSDQHRRGIQHFGRY